jgi:hypothetical protein
VKPKAKAKMYKLKPQPNGTFIIKNSWGLEEVKSVQVLEVELELHDYVLFHQ